MQAQVNDDTSFRDSAQYVGKERWKRSMLPAHAGTQARLYREDVKEKSAFNKAIAYLKIRVVLWAWHYLRSRFGRKWPFPDYTTVGEDNGIYDLVASPENTDPAEPVLISLLGDWGSGTKEAYDVAERVKQDSPHFTIHLGDIYYVGSPVEVQENMLGEKVQWPTGSYGKFALNANHEMYAQGKGYFKYLLPELGLNDGQGQKASFFCLKNEHWLVIGLDTGYYSIGVPIVELVIRPSAKLHDKLLAWLREEVRLGEDLQRGVIFLSHHQCYSQFESGYPQPAEQLAQLIRRPVLWVWGHEHRFAIYGKHAAEQAGLQAYGRCVGHGGLPIEDIRGEPRQGEKYQVGLVLYDKRERTKIGALETPVGYNGYANLTFEGKKLSIEYKDTVQPLVRESWEVGEGGVLKGVSIEKFIDDDDLVVVDGKRLEEAII